MSQLVSDVAPIISYEQACIELWRLVPQVRREWTIGWNMHSCMIELRPPSHTYQGPTVFYLGGRLFWTTRGPPAPASSGFDVAIPDTDLTSGTAASQRLERIQHDPRWDRRRTLPNASPPSVREYW